MKKYISILLVLLLLLNSIGYILLYLERLASNRQQLKAIIKTQNNMDEIRKFTFTRAGFTNLNWKEENEFEYFGKMYDIAKVETIDSIVIVYCIHDEMEDYLISNFERIFNQNSTKDRIHTTFQLTLLTFNFLAIQPNVKKVNSTICSLPFSLLQVFNYCSFTTELLTPPPRASKV